ncbi:pectate lyase [Synechococcus phage S-CREM2]|nr:pectate lyase [Synechococcus phage S-CREM2]
MNFKKWFKEWYYEWFVGHQLYERRLEVTTQFKDAIFRLGKPFGDFPDAPTSLGDWNPMNVLNIAENMLLLQNTDGSWDKNLPIRSKFEPEEVKEIFLYGKYKNRGNLDNGANWKHLRLLATVYNVTKAERYRESASKCLDWILSQQHPVSGSWMNANHPYITYNDDVTQGVLVTFQDILTNDYGDYDWVSEQKLKEVEDSYLRGIDCVLKTQHRSGGWAQQHSHETLEPCWARSYEGPWLATRESATVCRMLDRHLRYVPYMYAEDVETAVHRCKFWLTLTRLSNGSWPRFLFPGTTTPVFCDREGNIYKTWEELPEERRYGYGWFVSSPWEAL